MEAQIKKVCNKGNPTKSGEVYKLKADTGRLCSKANYYTQDQLNYMNTELREFMHFFGYANHPTIDTPT